MSATIEWYTPHLMHHFVALRSPSYLQHNYLSNCLCLHWS